MTAIKLLKRVVLIATLLFGATTLYAADADPDTNTEMWSKVRKSLFDNRPISEKADNVIQLDAPVRAEDAATVPISIKTQLQQNPNEYVKKIYLIVDKNPSPIAAIFTMTPDSGRADLETRIRVEEYSYIRVVAEMNDGKLYGVSRYIKASGGCSAPAGKDQAEAMSKLGKIKMRLENDVKYNQPNLVQLMVNHPNYSGLAMDQVTRLFVPAHYVRRVNVTYADKPILTADVDFSISENPNFRFYFVPKEKGVLKAEVEDTTDKKFNSTLEVKQGAS
ncbi:MAG: quinoprotein dehydrogenase-associated SoxYZ-like carrier [Burkholderiales bacterium]